MRLILYLVLNLHGVNCIVIPYDRYRRGNPLYQQPFFTFPEITIGLFSAPAKVASSGLQLPQRSKKYILLVMQACILYFAGSVNTVLLSTVRGLFLEKLPQVF
jgi:hypothetical protein